MGVRGARYSNNMNLFGSAVTYLFADSDGFLFWVVDN